MQTRIAKVTVVSLGLAVFLGNSLVNAADYYWACGSGNWNSTCWSNTEGGAPTLGSPPDLSNVYLLNSGASNVAVNFQDNFVGGAVSINATGTGAMVFSQTEGAFGHPLAVTNVGTSGTGTYNQSGGTSGGLILGPGGTYNLSGGRISGHTQSIFGTFNQTGGFSNGAESFNVGSGGTFNLSGGQSSAGFSFGGLQISEGGTFNQTGGLHAIGTFNGTFGGVILDGGTYNLQGGVLVRSGTLSEGSIINRGGTFNFTGGTLSVGTFDGSLINNGGTLAPGYGTVFQDTDFSLVSLPGKTNIVGNYIQSALGAYAAEIGGLVKGTDYDTLSVSGTANLNGLLSVSFLDLGTGLFSPNLGDSFDVLSAERIIGGFSSFSLPTLGQNESWKISYIFDAIGTSDVVRLSVAPVPEPEIYVMMAVGLGLVGFVARRKKVRVSASA